jgi:glutamate 5-kinase
MPEKRDDLGKSVLEKTETHSRATLKDSRRVVIKIGTQTISAADGPGVDTEYLRGIAASVASLRSRGIQVLLVSSGAIGMGARALGLTQRSQSITMRQACASIGQPLLMQSYREAFLAHNLVTAQVLVTRDLFNHRESFNNLRNSVEKLLKLGAVPIINENDSISTEEIGRAFGDNDQLSAHVASKVDAELLILLSDVEGLYDRNPRQYEDASLIPYVSEVEDRHRDSARGKGSAHSTGGMATKLLAVETARDAGCRVVLAHGRKPDIIRNIIDGKRVGTLFESATAIRQRSRWIKNAEPSGEIIVDDGALDAILNHRSLLPRGIIRVEGVFPRGSVVLVNRRVKLITSFDSGDLLRIIGRHSGEIPGILGEGSPDIIARPEDMYILEA